MTYMLKLAHMEAKAKEMNKKKQILEKEIQEGTANRVVRFTDAEEKVDVSSSKSSSSRSFLGDEDISFNTNDARLILIKKQYIQKSYVKVIKGNHDAMFERLFKVLPKQMA